MLKVYDFDGNLIQQLNEFCAVGGGTAEESQLFIGKTMTEHYVEGLERKVSDDVRG
jgi:hypothetical protein